MKNADGLRNYGNPGRRMIDMIDVYDLWMILCYVKHNDR